MAKIITGVLSALVLACGPALANLPMGNGPIASPSRYPGAPKPIYDDRNISPYPMNYADEAVQTLGFRDGHMDVFTATPPAGQAYLPTFSGGLGGDGAMLKLQWHPGE